MTSIADLDGQGLCAQVDPELFFPSKGQPGYEARRVCAACPVQVQCLEIAMQDGVSGIWGGTSHADRVQLGAPRIVHVAELVRTCGTEAGARRHHRAGEPACQPCASAAASAQRMRAEVA